MEFLQNTIIGSPFFVKSFFLCLLLLGLMAFFCYRIIKKPSSRNELLGRLVILVFFIFLFISFLAISDYYVSVTLGQKAFLQLSENMLDSARVDKHINLIVKIIRNVPMTAEKITFLRSCTESMLSLDSLTPEQAKKLFNLRKILYEIFKI